MALTTGAPAMTQEEIDFLSVATLAPRIADDGTVSPLDRYDSPSYNYLMAKDRSRKKLGTPIQGGFRFNVKSNRGQKITWWDGADLLPFQTKQTVSKMDYYVGKGHLGDELLYDLIERTGIRVDYSKGIREGASKRSDIMTVVNVIEENADDIRYNWTSEFRKHIWRDNVAQTKCFTGLDGLFPVSSNSTGTIGTRARSSPLFRHQLITGVTVDTLMLSFFQMIRKCNRKAGGSKIDYIVCGDTFYDTLCTLFSGTSTVGGKFDWGRAREWAAKMGEKYNVGLPQDCFAYDDILIVCDPVFEELDNDDAPATTWGKRCYFLNTEHVGVVPVMQDVVVPHGMPYNQRLQRTSYHGEATVWCNLPQSQGVMVLA